jgi:hypothetical protein
MVTLDSYKNLVISTFEDTDESEETCIDKFRKIIPTKHKGAKIGLLQANWISCGGSFSKSNPKLEIDEVQKRYHTEFIEYFALGNWNIISLYGSH